MTWLGNCSILHVYDIKTFLKNKIICYYLLIILKDHIIYKSIRLVCEIFLVTLTVTPQKYSFWLNSRSGELREQEIK
jgi:hypothetical protein